MERPWLSAGWIPLLPGRGGRATAPFLRQLPPHVLSLSRSPGASFLGAGGVLATLAPSPARTHQLLSPPGSPHSSEVTPVQDPPCAPHASAPLRIVPTPELITSVSDLQRAKQQKHQGGLTTVGRVPKKGSSFSGWRSVLVASKLSSFLSCVYCFQQCKKSPSPGQSMLQLCDTVAVSCFPWLDVPRSSHQPWTLLTGTGFCHKNSSQAWVLIKPCQLESRCHNSRTGR